MHFDFDSLDIVFEIMMASWATMTCGPYVPLFLNPTLIFEKKSMGGEMSFRPLVRPRHSLPFVTIVILNLVCHKM
jgi:hypothetical protein